MNDTTFLLRMPQQLKDAIADCARVEDVSQADIIRKAIAAYLLVPFKQRKN